MSNIFRQIIRHVQQTLRAEEAVGVPALVARPRAEGVFFYEDESPEELTHHWALRLIELHELMKESRGSGRREDGRPHR